MIDYNELNQRRWFPYAGFTCNAIALVLLVVLGWAVWFAGLDAWGFLGAGGWAGILFGLMFVVWFVLARISGVLNLAVCCLLCFSGFFGRDGAVNHTRNIHKVAVFLRVDTSNLDIRSEIRDSFHNQGDPERDAQLVVDWRHEMERSWLNYGTFINPWYTKERFDRAMYDFETWFSTHNWPADGYPPAVPYMGNGEQLERWRERGEVSPNDAHAHEKPAVMPKTAPAADPDEDSPEFLTRLYAFMRKHPDRTREENAREFIEKVNPAYLDRHEKD